MNVSVSDLPNFNVITEDTVVSAITKFNFN
jgi:hypothetical protein